MGDCRLELMEMENIDNTLTGSEQSKSRLDGRRDPAVDFLREQHVISLQGLHAEIEKLHKTCADLQFQLVFNGIKRSGSPPSSCSASSSNVDDDEEETPSSVAAQLSETTRTCRDLRATIEQLEHRIRQQEERYQEDIGARNLIVARLRKEVQEKKNTISNLVKLLRVRPDRCQAGVNLNRDEILRRAEAQIGSIEPGPLLTVFSPKVGGRSSQSSSSSSSSSATSRPTKSKVASMSHLGKQLVEKYCSGGGSRQMNAGTFPVTSSAEQAGQNGNPPRRPDSLSGPLMPANVDDTPMRPSSVSILEPWSPHQSNGRN